MMMGRAGPLGVDMMRVLYVEGSEGVVEEKPSRSSLYGRGKPLSQLSTVFKPTLLMISGFAAGSGKSIRWWVSPQIDLNRRSLRWRPRRYTGNWISICRILHYCNIITLISKTPESRLVGGTCLLSSFSPSFAPSLIVVTTSFQTCQERARDSWSWQSVHHSECNKPRIPSSREKSPTAH
jgi:hypothetical protein